MATVSFIREKGLAESITLFWGVFRLLDENSLFSLGVGLVKYFAH